MKIEIKRMYDAVKAIEVEELKKKLEAVGGSYEFAEDERPCLDIYTPGDQGTTLTCEVDICKIYLTCDILQFVAVISGSDEEVMLDVDAFMYGGLSYIADEIPYPRQVWMRIGCTVRGTKEQMDAMMKSDDLRLAKYTLKDMLDNGQVEIDGNTYIPERCVESYGKEYGEDIEPCDMEIIG